MFNKIRWFLFYRKIIRKNRLLLYNNHNIKIDWVNRMYKTYTFTEKDLDEIKVYGDSYINVLLDKDKSKLENTLIDLKILQFVALIEMTKLNDKQIGMAFRYKYFDTAKIANLFIWFIILFTIIYFFYIIKFGLNSIYFGLISTFVLYVITRLFKVSRTEN